MDTVESILFLVREAWSASSRLPFDPGFWGVVFAVLVLVSIFSIGRSLGRLNRRLSSAEAELAEIRSALKRIERNLDRSQAKPSPTGKQNQHIWDIPLREREEKP